MTDEELGETLREAFERHKSPAWLDTDDNPLTWYLPRVRERWLATARDVWPKFAASKHEAMMADAYTHSFALERERTAATILTALIQASTVAMVANGKHGEVTVVDMIPDAVDLADALRARLAEKP